MPKRKSSNSSDRIKQKIRRLERKLRRQRHRSPEHRYYSEDSSTTNSSRGSPAGYYEDKSYVDNQEVVLELDKSPVELVAEEEQTRSNPEPLLEPVPGLSQPGPSAQISSVIVVAQNPVDPTLSRLIQEPGPSTGSATAPETEDLELDSEVLDILGVDPTTDKKYGNNLHKDLAARFQHWATMGLTKEVRKELFERYLTPENAKLIDPPELNAEIKAAVTEIIAKRDKAIENKQKQLTLAISSLGEAVSLILSSKEKNTVLLKLLMDSTRIVCDCQHTDTITRRNFLLNAVKKDVREQLQNTKIDKFLFGENLAETLKSAKAINKSGTDLKPPAPKPANRKFVQNTPNSSKNWKNPGPSRKSGPPRMKEPGMTSTRSRPSSSSKQSQQAQRRQSHHRR